MKVGFIIVWVIVSGVLIVNLWRSHPADSPTKKIFWTLVLFAPIFGWIFYGGMYKAPGVQPPHLRARQTPGIGSVGRR